MINLKNTVKYALLLAGLCLGCLLTLVGGGYAYLSFNTEKTDNKASKVPYEFAPPENAGIMFEFCGDRTFVYLNFENEEMKIVFPLSGDLGDTVYGYSVDYTVKGDYYLLAEIIDAADGIELQSDDGKYRYTGVQIAELLSNTVDTEELKRNIITALTSKTADFGIDENVFYDIIKKGDTNLTVPDCHRWAEYLSLLCKNCTVVN